MMTTLRDVIGIQVQLFPSRLMTPIRQNWRIILPLVLQILMGLSIFTCMGLICNQDTFITMTDGADSRTHTVSSVTVTKVLTDTETVKGVADSVEFLGNLWQ